MSIRQTIISKLRQHGIDISDNQLEGVIYYYKKKYKDKYRGIDLFFDMIDDENQFLEFKEFIKTNNKTRLVQPIS